MTIKTDMKTLEYKISFTTPAFLGNAEQQAQWRTPPFKALLRQWWRVAAAPLFNYDYQRLREGEGKLFGHAWLENDRDEYGQNVNGRKSKVMIRFSHWCVGRQGSDWPGGQMEKVVTTRDGKGRVRADLYLGFGAVLPPSRKEGRSSISLRAGAIAAGEENTLALRFPENSKLEDTLQLIGWFGTVGSRSRNGWGSLQLNEINLPSHTDLQTFSRSLSECMKLDWPHALGKDERGNVLVWVTEPKKDWRAAMSALAHIKVGVRMQAKTFRDRSKIGGIHLLGYPAGSDWEIREWSKGNPKLDDQEGRLATQLRFKVTYSEQGFIGIIYHLPAKMPDTLRNRLNSSQHQWLESNELAVWQAVHAYLDNNVKISRM